MNYYIVTVEVFDTLTKGNISFMLKSIDTSKRIVITSDEVSNNLHTFVNVTALSEYTITNTNDWVGDGQGIDVLTFEENKYIPEIDD